MHPVANQLIQLQELMFIREEQRVAGGQGRLEDLDRSILAMRKKLPALVRRDFENLHERHVNAIVQVSNGNCTGCGMQLPRSLIQLVRLVRDLHVCPNCARILFYTEGEIVRTVGKSARRVGPRPVGIARFSSPELMVPHMASTDKEAAITELAVRMEEQGFVDSGERLKEMAMRRESILSTAVDKGLAFPHVRGVEGGALTIAVGTSEQGIDFKDHEQDPTHIVFLLAIPTAASAFYLKLLAGLTETFMKKAARDTLMAETQSVKMWKVLAKLTRLTIK